MRITCTACESTEDLGPEGFPGHHAKNLKSANQTIGELNEIITLLVERLGELGHRVAFGK